MLSIVHSASAAAFLFATLCPVATALTVNADFSRDIVNGNNPGANPAPVLFAGTGPAPDIGTLWNDLQVPLSGETDAINQPLLFADLAASDGSATGISIELTGGFTSSFNSGTPLASSVVSLQNDRVFPSLGALATLSIKGLDPSKTYSVFLIGAVNFSTAFTIDSVTKIAAGAIYDGAWTEGGEHVTFSGISPTAGGVISVGIRDGADPIDSFGVIAGLQIAEMPVNMLYPVAASTTGGQFSASYPPSKLMNNDFAGPASTISTLGNYSALDENYATASGTTSNFDLIFEFEGAAEIRAMHVWNYIYRSGATGGSTSFNSGVNSFTLTFFDSPGGVGSTIGSVFAGNLAKARFNALNSAQSVYFPATYPNVRSVRMRVLSNHGATGFTGMNELAFDGIIGDAQPAIESFTAASPFAQRPSTNTLNWTVSGEINSLQITPGIGDVTSLTTDGTGSISVSPIGEQTYTLTLNGTVTRTVSVVGLPAKNKVHLYLLIGQSNMQGAGAPYSGSLDAPHPRVLKFGSRTGMEPVFVKGSHNLTVLETTNGGIGMGVEFGKTLLESQSDPEVVIGLINHAIGSSAIQWWAPGVMNNKQVNPVTGLNHYLYDEAVQRMNAAANHGLIKGVLWHQGEYNCGSNTNPDADPEGYAARIQALVSNLRTSFGKPSLPFVCGKLVPATWTYENGNPGVYNGLPFRSIVEGAMEDLPNHRTNTFCVNNDGLRGRSDQLIHFDSYSQRLLGQRYAGAILGFQADPVKAYLGGFLSPAQLEDPLLTAPMADIDSDGLNNLLEYAFATSPVSPQAAPPVELVTVNIPGEGDFPAVRFLRRDGTDAPAYVVEVSDDLATWMSNNEGEAPVTAPAGVPIDHGNGTSTVTLRAMTPLAPGSPKHFLRVRVSIPQTTDPG